MGEDKNSFNEKNKENILEPESEKTDEIENEIEDVTASSANSVPDDIKHAKEDKSKIIKKLEKALENAEEERDAFKDSYQRTFSEFNNYKKRNQAVAAQAIKTGACDTVEKILPVLDNFERALEHADDVQDSAFAQGVMMVYKQLGDIIAAMGITEIPALGEVFDPNLHHAIQQVEAKEDEPPNTVVAVVQKGYMLGEKIIRHSMVIVSK
ncbi:MAG: nucleotide exchange factor GrpE [Eubacteriales bacterium]|nr:nucleotide exchange factor GrpE [Eubacteriales bacterium]